MYAIAQADSQRQPKQNLAAVVGCHPADLWVWYMEEGTHSSVFAFCSVCMLEVLTACTNELLYEHIRYYLPGTSVLLF